MRFQRNAGTSDCPTYPVIATAIRRRHTQWSVSAYEFLKLYEFLSSKWLISHQFRCCAVCNEHESLSSGLQNSFETFQNISGTQSILDQCSVPPRKRSLPTTPTVPKKLITNKCIDNRIIMARRHQETPSSHVADRSRSNDKGNVAAIFIYNHVLGGLQ